MRSIFRVDRDAPPVVVGHRGAPRVAVENTPASFAAAASAGATWVELDVRRSADDVLLVHHDPSTPDGLVLVEHTAEDLAVVGVFALAAVLRSLPAGIGVDLEVKNLPGDPDYDEHHRVATLLAALLSHVPRRPLLASSFNPETVAALAANLPGVPAGLIHAPTLALPQAVDLAGEFGATVVCPHADAEGLDAAGIAGAHDLGMPVLVWTVDEPERARALARAGADAICTNDPAGIVAALAQPS